MRIYQFADALLRLLSLWISDWASANSRVFCINSCSVLLSSVISVKEASTPYTESPSARINGCELIEIQFRAPSGFWLHQTFRVHAVHAPELDRGKSLRVFCRFSRCVSSYQHVSGGRGRCHRGPTNIRR